MAVRALIKELARILPNRLNFCMLTFRARDDRIHLSLASLVLVSQFEIPWVGNRQRPNLARTIPRMIPPIAPPTIIGA